MSDDRNRFNKVLAVAINPGAYEKEAVAALLKARELVRQNPSLAHLPEPPPPPTPPPTDSSVAFKLTNISPFWLNIVTGNLSQEAYGLGLKSKIEYDFKQTPTDLEIRCDGPAAACVAFEQHVNWLIKYVNSQPAKP